MAVRTRRATNQVAWPYIMLAGEDKAGKSYTLAKFCASPKVGKRFWLDLNEGAADEYVSLSFRDKDDEGYLIVDHDGTFRDIYNQILEVEKEAIAAHEAGEPPVLLCVDSETALWTALSQWATRRAERNKANQRKLAADPDADIDVGPLYWNQANKHYRQIQDVFMRMPGIVVSTARLGEKTVMDDAGRPTPEKKWKADVQKNAPYNATATIYVRREGRVFTLAGARSLFIEQKDGHEIPLADGDLDLEKFIWEGLRCSQEASGGRNMPSLTVDAAETYLDEIHDTNDLNELRDIWTRAMDKMPPTQDRDRVTAAVKERKAYLESRPPDDEEPQDPTQEDTGAKIRAAAKALTEAANA